MSRDLAGFRGVGYNKGRGKAIQFLWAFLASPVVRSIWCPSALRIIILRAFGAKIGKNVLIRHDVTIHWPWKLSIGDNSWIGVRVWILDLEPITIGKNVCVSQGAMLCAGSHDPRSPTFEFDNGPIVICDEAWIATRACVLRGVTVGKGAIVGAMALAYKNVPSQTVMLASSGDMKGGDK